MAEQAFTYDEHRLTRCANLSRRLFLRVDEEDDNFQCSASSSPFLSRTRTKSWDDEVKRIVLMSHEEWREECFSLFQDYSVHFRRTMEEKDTDDSQDGAASSLGMITIAMSPRFCRFLESVLFVDSHNNQQKIDPSSSSSHRVTLNRFSDVPRDEIFPTTEITSSPSKQHDTTPQATSRGWLRHAQSNSTSRGLALVFQQQQQHTKKRRSESSSSAMLELGHGSFNKLSPKSSSNKKRRKNHLLPSRTYRIPATFREPFHAAPNIGRQLDGFLVTIKKNKEAAAQENDFWDYDIGDAVPPKDGGDYNRFLNWATSDNPDGVPIVHHPVDQGSCGSCWALAATGSMEATAARRSAYAAYKSFTSTAKVGVVHESKKKQKRDAAALRAKAIQIAQKVETRAMQALNLSIQELIDCDNTVDQGCTGGNPLLAFHYIHRYGLVSWEDYPYTGRQEDTCQQPINPRRPLATVQGWGMIQSNHEKHMELALRYLGPIAVGLNGASPSFLSYMGGIFDDVNCKEGANHALLIVGYGEETDAQGRTIKYWIARNSWGLGWGEDGYVRIKRGSGAKGNAGVCGIASSASVAIGGMLLGEEQNILQQEGLKTDFEDPIYMYCSRMGWNERPACLRVGGWLYDHKALLLGMVGLTCMVLTLFTLTIDCRRQRRRQREREERRRQSYARTRYTTAERRPQQQRPHKERTPRLHTERTPLLAAD